MTKLLRSRTVAVAAGAAVLVGIGGVGAANAAGVHLAWGSVGSHQIRNNSVRSVDIHNGTIGGWDVHNGAIGMRDLNGYTQRQIKDNAPTLVSTTTDAVPVAHIGGKFADNATKIGSLDLQPGTYMVNAEGFFESTAATSGKSQMELALRDDAGNAYGTCFTGETSPLKGRDASCASTQAVTVDAPTTVDVYAFGYQDDQSATDSGSWVAVANVNALQVQ